MSIEVTRLTYNQGIDINYIKNWFEANASEYFDECDIVDGKGLVLKKGDRDYLLLSRDSSYFARLFVNDHLTVNMNSSKTEYVSRLTKTPHGVAVGFAKASNIAAELSYGIFITKTNKGNIGVIGNSVLGETTGSNLFYFESIGGSLYSVATSVNPYITPYDVTTLTPVVCDKANGEYMPDCFFTTFSQYKGIDCTFIADGTEYLYNGFIAMR